MNEINPTDLYVEIINHPVSGFAPLRPMGIKITHVPTGLFAISEAARSQHGNRDLAYHKLKQLLGENKSVDLSREAFDLWRQSNISTEKDAYAFMEGWKAARQTTETTQTRN